MKRIFFFRLFIFFILLSYFSLLLLSIFGVIFPFYKNWFSYALIALALLIFPRYIYYGIDTNLWCGMLLTLCGGFGILVKIFELSTVYCFIGYIFCFTLTSFIIFLFFRQIFHFKIFTFTFLSDIILYVYAKGLMPLWLMISLISAISLFAIIFAVKAIKSNTRKV